MFMQTFEECRRREPVQKNSRCPEPERKQQKVSKTVRKCQRWMSAETIGRCGVENVARIAVANGEQVGVRVDAALRNTRAAGCVQDYRRRIFCRRRTFAIGGSPGQIVDRYSPQRRGVELFHLVPEIGL